MTLLPKNSINPVISAALILAHRILESFLPLVPRQERARNTRLKSFVVIVFEKMPDDFWKFNRILSTASIFHCCSTIQG